MTAKSEFKKILSCVLHFRDRHCLALSIPGCYCTSWALFWDLTVAYMLNTRMKSILWDFRGPLFVPAYFGWISAVLDIVILGDIKCYAVWLEKPQHLNPPQGNVGSELVFVSSYKYCGFWLDSFLSFNTEITNLHESNLNSPPVKKVFLHTLHQTHL